MGEEDDRASDADEEELDDSDAEEIRGVILLTVSVRGGTLKVCFHEATEDLRLIATCDCHDRCRKTRSLLPHASGRHIAQGRPVGYLLAWLAKGVRTGWLTAFQHKGRTKGAYMERVDQRIDFKESHEHATELLEYERPQWPRELGAKAAALTSISGLFVLEVAL